MIRTDYLIGERLEGFESIRHKVEEAYEQVIDSLTDKSAMPYLPNLYPTPFMLVMQYKVRGRLVRTLCYALTYPDARNFDHLAIYITSSVIHGFPQYMVGIIAHEIAHIISLNGKVEVTQDNLRSILRDRSGYIQAKERDAENYYVYFADPIPRIIKEWDVLGDRQDIGEYVANDAELVNSRRFQQLVFRDKLNNFHEFIKSKLRELGQI